MSRRIRPISVPIDGGHLSDPAKPAVPGHSVAIGAIETFSLNAGRDDAAAEQQGVRPLSSGTEKFHHPQYFGSGPLAMVAANTEVDFVSEGKCSPNHTPVTAAPTSVVHGRGRRRPIRQSSSIKHGIGATCVGRSTGRTDEVDEASVRTTAEGILRAAFSGLVSVNEWGSVLVSLPVTPVVCRARAIGSGVVVLNVSSPILLDFVPPADFYELIAVSQIGLPFGAIVTAAGQAPGQIMIEFRAQLLTEPLQPAHVIAAVRMVHDQTVAQIENLERITPPLDGVRAYAVPEPGLPATRPA